YFHLRVKVGGKPLLDRQCGEGAPAKARRTHLDVQLRHLFRSAQPERALMELGVRAAVPENFVDPHSKWSIYLDHGCLLRRGREGAASLALRLAPPHPGNVPDRHGIYQVPVLRRQVLVNRERMLGLSVRLDERAGTEFQVIRRGRLFSGYALAPLGEIAVAI